jgi:hypothetical protein
LLAEWLQSRFTRKEEGKKLHRRQARRIKDALKTRDPSKINAALSRRGVLDTIDGDTPVSGN